MYVKDKSMLPDDLLYHDRLYQLAKTDSGKYRSKDGLSRRTKGYQYYCGMKVGVDKIGPIRKPETKYTVHKDFKIGNGQVDSLWVVTSSTDKSGSSLKDRCKERVFNRAVPQVSSFDDYVRMRTSCYILEEKDGVFYCDCWEGMKGKQDKHCIAMMYYTGKWLAEADVRAVALGKSRKPGRPKKIPHCLTRSPSPSPRTRSPSLSPSPSTPPVPSPRLPSPPPVPSPPPLRRTTRRNVLAGKRTRAEIEDDDMVDDRNIGFSKPPKKKAKQANGDRSRGGGRGRGRGRGKGRGK